MERKSIKSFNSFKDQILRSKEQGQAAVEYVLMLVVVTSIIVSILSYLKRNHLGSLEDCLKTSGQKGLVCQIYGSLGLSSVDDGKRFKYFKFKR